jgi:transposase
MYIAVVPNRSSPPAILLRQSYRKGGKVCSRTLANLSQLSPQQIDAMRRVLRGEEVFPREGPIRKVRDRAHGAVDAVQKTIGYLGLERIIDRKPSRERDLVVAMIVSRVVDAESKLATMRTLATTTLPEERKLEDANEDDLYAAMDWLLARQDGIEKRLAKRHLKDKGLVLYDLSSSYFEGHACPLAKFGYNRDGKRGKLQVNYGLLTDERGCPLAIRAYPGNTSDSTTLNERVEQVREGFGIEELVIVGDRGMISDKQIKGLRKLDGVAWITALKTGQIRVLAKSGSLGQGCFDRRNLTSIEHPRFSGERLIACKNSELAKLRAHKRQSLIDATCQELDRVQAMASKGNLEGAGPIGVRIGKVVNKYKVAKHFKLDIDEASFSYRIREERVAEEAALDGLYVIRTPLSPERANDEQAVRHYKKLTQVERAFRSMKTIDLKIRPIYHRLENRVRAHIFLCMLAYYVEWHMREAWRPVLFADEDQAAKETRDPVAPAKRSAAALQKCSSKTLKDGTPAHSFRTLLADLATITRSTFSADGDPNSAHAFTMTTTPSAGQARAFDLLKAMAV